MLAGTLAVCVVFLVWRIFYNETGSVELVKITLKAMEYCRENEIMPKKLTGKWKSVDTLNVQSDGFQYRLIQVENELFVLGYSDGNKVENIGYGHSDSFDVGSIIEISWVNVPSNFSYIPASHKLKLEIVDENSVSVYEVVSGQNKSYGNWKRV